MVTLGHTQKIALSGLSPSSTVTWKPGKKSLVSIGHDGTVSAGYTTGKSTVTIEVDGKTIDASRVWMNGNRFRIRGVPDSIYNFSVGPVHIF